MDWHRWLYVDAWVPLWPNIAASLLVWVWVRGVLARIERRSHAQYEALKRHVDKRHAALKAHIDDQRPRGIDRADDADGGP